MEVMSALEIEDLEKNFKGFKLDIPRLGIPKGFATALIGENGAGKSTLINILAGVRLDYKGTIRYFGGETDEKLIRENIGYTGPNNYFMPHWNLTNVDEVSSILFTQFHSEKFHELYKELGVDASRKSIDKMSDGMRMKTMLAAVLARDTRLLLLDEPASPLDPLMRDKLCSLIRDYLDEGNGEKSVLFSTHNISDMEDVTDYAIIMAKGRVVEEGFVEELKEKYIMVKGEKEDADKVKKLLIGIQHTAYGYSGLCLADNLDKLAGLDVAMETPTLSQISVGVMKQYTGIAMQ